MKMSKYGNKIVKDFDGEVFDSVKERNRWYELKLLERAKEITNLRRQQKFILIPSQRIDGKVVERECSYVADFTYHDRNGKFHVEDTKGFRTKDYIIKRKLMLYIHKLKIEEI
jgi:hypothetical protein